MVLLLFPLPITSSCSSSSRDELKATDTASGSLLGDHLLSSHPALPLAGEEWEKQFPGQNCPVLVVWGCRGFAMWPQSTRHSWACSPSLLLLPTAGLSFLRCLYGPHKTKLQVYGTANAESTKPSQPRSFLSPLSFQGGIQGSEAKVGASLPPPSPAASSATITGRAEGPQTRCGKRWHDSPQPVPALSQTWAHRHSL